MTSTEPRCDLDSHADTCVFGRHCRVLHTYSHTLNVTGFHSSMKTLKNVHVACVCVAYDCASTMNTYILVFDQCLYIPSLDVNLLCVDQMRDHGLTVNDVPLIRLSKDERTIQSHSIMCNDTGLHIPLLFDKPISYFKCRVPMIDEIENNQSLTTHMTSSVKWEPYDETTNQIEENIRRNINSNEREIDSLTTYSNPYISSCPLGLSQIISHFEEKVCGVKTSGKSYLIKPEQLARRWRTSLECATRTLKKTEQRALRDWTRVQGDRRFRPTQLQLRYPRINCVMYCDVKYGPCRSLEGNTCLVVYATKFQWAKAYPLSQENYVSNSLTNLFRDVGFPSAIVPDNAASLTKGEFKKIAGRAQVPIYPLEPYNPNQSTAEDMIREATRLYQRFMTARNIPKVL